MNEFAFKLFDAINREGIDNSFWGLVEDIDDTEQYFGTVESAELPGKWAYIYKEKGAWFTYIDDVEPTMVLHVEDCDILAYRLD